MEKTEVCRSWMIYIEMFPGFKISSYAPGNPTEYILVPSHAKPPMIELGITLSLPQPKGPEKISRTVCHIFHGLSMYILLHHTRKTLPVPE